MTSRFYDRNHAFQYLVGREIARRLVDDPSLIETAKLSLKKHAGSDPQNNHSYRVWSKLLQNSVDEIAKQLSQNDAHGDLVRQTRPPFIALPPSIRVQLLEEAHNLCQKL